MYMKHVTNMSLKKREMVTVKKHEGVWTDEETVTFQKLKHEIKIMVIFP